MATKPKVAIVAAGGGMRSAHGAGFLYALATDLHLTDPDIVVASSGNAGNLLYFITRQYDILRTVWAGGFLSTRRFISFWRVWEIMNIDYLVETIFKDKFRLDTAALESSTCKYFVSVTDFATGHSRYVCREDAIDPFELLRATTALPFFFGKRVIIKGGRYLDGELGLGIQDHMERAVAEGATRILAIDDTLPKKPITKLFLKTCARFAPAGLRNAIVRELSTKTTCLTANGVMVVCVQPGVLPAQIITRDPGKLAATFEEGRSHALAMEKELRTLFA